MEDKKSNKKQSVVKSLSKFVVPTVKNVMHGAIMVSMMVGGHLPMARASAANNPLANLNVNEIKKGLIEKLSEQDPRIEMIANSPGLPTPDLSQFNSLRDENPYFLRGQQWNECRATEADAEYSEDVYVKSEKSESTVVIKNYHQCLTLPLEAKFLTSNEDFILLSSPLSNEGLFFLDTTEVSMAASVKNPVPVHFIALPVGNRNYASYIADLDAFMLGDQHANAEMPVFVSDLRNIAKWQMINLAFASAANEAENTESLREMLTTFGQTGARVKNPMMMPKPGSTMNFGLVLAPDTVTSPVQTSMLNRAYEKLLQQLIPTANASDADVYAHLVQKLITFSYTFGSFYAFSVLLKYTALKEKITGVRAYRREKELQKAEAEAKAKADAEAKAKAEANIEAETTAEPEAILESEVKTDTEVNVEAGANEESQADSVEAQPVEKKSAVKLAKREIREMFDVFAATLTFVGQSASHFSANSLENLMDRYLPIKGAEKNSKARKFLQWTYLWMREISSRTPVNATTFYLGAIVMGSVDTAMVFVQIAYFVPWLCMTTIPLLNEFFKSRVLNAFSPENAAMKAYIVNDTVRNLIAWVASGAASYSQDSKAQILDQIRDRVRDEMLTEGQNPDDPKFKKALKTRIDDLVDAELMRLGLPSQKEFLYDFTTLDSLWKRLTGHADAKLDLPAAPVKPALARKYRKGLPSAKEFANDKRGQNLLAWTEHGLDSLKHDFKADAKYWERVKGAVWENVLAVYTRAQTNAVDKITDAGNANEQYAAAFDDELRAAGMPGENDFSKDFSALQPILESVTGIVTSSEKAEVVVETPAAIEEAAAIAIEEDADKEPKDDGESEMIGENRPGLVWGALKVALKDAKRRQAESGNFADVVAMLEDINKQRSAWAMVKSPIEFAKYRRKLARTLTVLSLPMETAQKTATHVPEMWGAKYGEATAAKAAWLFQRTIYSIESGKSYLRSLDLDIIKKFRHEARENMAKEGIYKPGDELYDIMLENEIVVLHEISEQKKAADAYQPPKLDKVASVEHRRASLKAFAKTIQDETNPNLNDEERSKKFNEIYAEELARQSSIYPESGSDFVTKVHEQAQKDTEQYLSKTQGAQEYAAKLNTDERMQYIGEIYAEAFVTAYNNLAHDGKLLPALSTEQTGRFQQLRQKEWVKKSTTLTRIIRLAESSFSDETGYKTGAGARRARNIPLWYDLKIAGIQNVQRFLPAVTTSYVFAKYVWQITMPWPVWALSYTTLFMISAPSRWLQRVFRQQGIQPMGGAIKKTLYSLPYAWVTFFGTIATMVFAQDAMHGAEHVVEWGRQVAHHCEAFFSANNHPVFQDIQQIPAEAIPAQ